MLEDKCIINDWIPEKSEVDGLSALNGDEKHILSIGISTNGFAEMYMANKCPHAEIIATTMDSKGLIITKNEIKKFRLTKRINAKIEDVALPMPYKENYFDFIYARLVLHYLNKKQLTAALKEIHRVINPNGIFYFVVKSDKELISKEQSLSFDETTQLTEIADPLKIGKSRYRQFFSITSITNYLVEAGFNVSDLNEFEEYTYHDYERTIKVDKPAIMISGKCKVNKS